MRNIAAAPVFAGQGSSFVETLVKTRSFSYLLAVLGFAFATSAAAVVGPYDSLFVFGDSLSDSGNNALALGVAGGVANQPITNTYVPSLPYAPTIPGTIATYSNGPVWSTQFASLLGLTLNPSLLPGGGTNFAFGGAQTSFQSPANGGFPFSLTTQANMALQATGGNLPSSALYVVAGGGNNARATLDAIAHGASAGSTIFNDANAYANDIYGIVQNLKTHGAQNIIVWNTPNLGTAPGLLAGGQLSSFLGTLTADAMNAALSTKLAGVSGVKIFDIYGIGNLPGAAAFTNKTSACGSDNIGCDTSLFWDAIHPTTAAHGFIASQMFALAVPEPSEIAMMLMGLLVVVGASRRKAA